MSNEAAPASSCRMAATTSDGHCSPCTCTCVTLKPTTGQRRRTLVMTSPSARACGAQIKPMQCGNSGNGFLRSASNRTSPLSFLRSSSIMAFRLPPAPAAMIASPRNDSDVRFIHTFGLPWMMTRSPCTNGAAAAANRPKPLTSIAMSCWSSRSVM